MHTAIVRAQTASSSGVDNNNLRDKIQLIIACDRKNVQMIPLLNFKEISKFDCF